MAESPNEAPGHNELADQAETLSRGLHKLHCDCVHESTAADISNVAQELILLATELRTLDSAVSANREQYTEAFEEDLNEMRTHLGGIFDDIGDCCAEMQKADGRKTSSITWLQKKRAVNKLHKHLEANKTALVVMRTVLHHGKAYGIRSSPERLAESSPHVMQEDRAILESIFASRKAISELHELTTKAEEESPASSSSKTETVPSFQPGAHGRNLSSATGVEVPALEDVLPPSKTVKHKQSEDSLAKRFSRRGIRLAVHSSILDANAHEVPMSLKKRWFHQGRARKSTDRPLIQDQSFAQLSRISEVNSTTPSEKVPEELALQRSATSPDNTYPRASGDSSEHSQIASGRLSKAKRRSLTLVASDVGKTLSKVITKLSNATNNADKNDKSSLETGKGKKEDGRKNGNDKSGWSYRLSKPFVQPELTTPDFDRDVENMGLR